MYLSHLAKSRVEFTPRRGAGNTGPALTVLYAVFSPFRRKGISNITVCWGTFVLILSVFISLGSMVHVLGISVKHTEISVTVTLLHFV